jgi:hypothetical protein
MPSSSFGKSIHADRNKDSRNVSESRNALRGVLMNGNFLMQNSLLAQAIPPLCTVRQKVDLNLAAFGGDAIRDSLPHSRGQTRGNL